MRARVPRKLEPRKLILTTVSSISRKFPPTKITRYTVLHCTVYTCTVLSRKSAHGRCILLSHQTGGWVLFRVFPHSTLKERPPYTITSSAIAAIEQQARVSQNPPSTSTSLESLATSPLTTPSSQPPSAG